MSYIDELTPKMQEAIKNRSEYIKNDYPKTENIVVQRIRGIIKEMVKKYMLGGMQPPDIKHYYWEKKYNGEDIEDDFGLDETKFSVFQGNIVNNDELENIILNEIGYKRCEIIFEDKIEQYDHQVKELFGYGMKWKTSRRNGKALWIHASMNVDGFSNVKSKGSNMIYNRTRGRD